MNLSFEEVVIDGPIEGDFLNRHDFIKQVKTVIELLSTNRKNSCFAITGCWGIGKSYVLDKLEKQLLFYQNEETALDKYFVFHFNCWEYDYYDEPLIAIVSAMLDEIRTKETLFSENARAHIINAAKFVFSKLYEDSSKWLESKIGINPKNITDKATEIHSDATKTIDDAQQYDKYLAFKQVLSTLRNEIKAVASEKTVIFVVDEMDRCIPEYQIKVLERLHHIFNDIDNMQVILAIDKAQLERTVQKMFGEHVNTQKYLAKFIKFEIELDEGTYNAQFEEMLGDYFNQFSETDNPDIIEFKEKIFEGIEVRERIAIVEKCHLLHSILNEEDSKKDATYMCVELFLTIVKHTNVQLPKKTYGIDFTNMFGNKPTIGLNFLRNKVSRTVTDYYGNETKAYYNMDGKYCYIKSSDLWGVLLGVYAFIIEVNFKGFHSHDKIVIGVEEYMGKFWNLLKTIK